MDHPTSSCDCATLVSSTCDCTSAVSTAAGACCGATLDEAPSLLAATHSSDAIAEVTRVVDLAEGAAPRVKRRRLERSGIVPTCDSGLGVLGFLLVGYNEEWADLIVARRRRHRRHPL